MKNNQPIRGRHHGETIVVLGNGPSLEGFDFSLLDGLTTIGVNCIGKVFDPNYLVFLDKTVWREHENLIRMSKAEVFVNDDHRLPIEAVYFGRYRPQDDEPILGGDFGRGLFWSFTSVFAALNLAYIFGADRIILLGVDMHDSSHFYSTSGTAQPFLNREKILTHFAHLAKFAWENGFKIYNANPKSAVKSLPFISSTGFQPVTRPGRPCYKTKGKK